MQFITLVSKKISHSSSTNSCSITSQWFRLGLGFLWFFLKIYFRRYWHSNIIDTYFQYVLCLVLFLNRKEKIFSKQDHSHFYRTLTATSFSDERFNLDRVTSLRKRRNTKSNINGTFLRRRPKFLASILCTNVIITEKFNYLYQNVRLKK